MVSLLLRASGAGPADGTLCQPNLCLVTADGLMMILLIDNYDSFVHNLARYLQRLGQETQVVRNDTLDVAEVRRRRPQALVLSPGPGARQQAGCCLDLVRALWQDIPILGVCLGHQVIAQALGGRIQRAPQPVHGRASPVHHEGTGVFAGVPSPFYAGRYHSLVVEERSLPPEVHVAARTDDEIVMAIEHRQKPVLGWQFHPESVLTEHGYHLLAAFLVLAGTAGPASSLSLASEMPNPGLRATPIWYEQPIQFH